VKNLSDSPHTPVLRNELIEGFGRLQKGIFIDCTIGYGGHSKGLLDANSDIKLIGIDRDEEAIKFNLERLKREFRDRVELVKGTFSEILPKILRESREPIVGILADFGVSSLQLDKKERGFAFDSNSLDMRMDRESNLTAKDVINLYPQNRLEDIFRKYGELREAKVLAREIVKERAYREIESAKEFSQIIRRVVRSGKKHPSTLPFQAVRVEVNDELREIESLLNVIEEFKPKGTVVALITFHSLEDRVVKSRFRRWSKDCICESGMMRCLCGGDNSLGKEINRKPIVASREEIEKNRRSRSAKLRLFKFK
jgi:16S rRNA (cytosine1402-N4)-methyltransferase